MFDRNKLPIEISPWNFTKEYSVRVGFLILIALANVVLLFSVVLLEKLFILVSALSLFVRSGCLLMLLGIILSVVVFIISYLENYYFLAKNKFSFALIIAGLFLTLSGFALPWLQGHPAILLSIVVSVVMSLLFMIFQSFGASRFQLQQLLYQGNNNSIIEDALLKIVDNTFVFGNTVYQVQNISSVTLAYLPETHLIIHGLKNGQMVRKFGLKIVMNSGESMIFMSQSKNFVLTTILQIYRFLNSEESKSLALTLNFRINAIEINAKGGYVSRRPISDNIVDNLEF
jgi:hypothetical protein